MTATSWRWWRESCSSLGEGLAAEEELGVGFLEGGQPADRGRGPPGEAGAGSASASASSDREVLQGVQRREFGGQAVDDQLVDVFGPAHVLQAVAAEVQQRDPFRQLAPHQGGGGLGEQNLAAVAAVGDAGGAVDVHADVALFDQPGLAGVQAHADAHLGVVRPGLGGQLLLHLDHRVDGVGGAGEGGEEGVALGVDLPAVELLEGGAQDGALVGQQARRIFRPRAVRGAAVEPAMSVKRKVTVPAGSPEFISPTFLMNS